METKGLTFFVQDPVLQLGEYEDGSAITAPVFFVVAQDQFGARWSHFMPFPSIKVRTGQDDEGWPYVAIDDVPNAAWRCQALLEKIQESEELDMDYWHEIDPEYGSDAYQAREFEMVAREKEEDLWT